MMKQTSVKAYRNLIQNGSISTSSAKVFDSIDRNGSKTRSQIARDTGMPINCVCGRVNELIADGVLKDGLKVNCPVTGHSAHLVGVV